MKKGKKKTLDNDTNTRCSKKPRDTTKKKYELFNFVSETGDSIYTSPVKDLHDGEIFYAASVVRKIVRQELVAAGVLKSEE